MSRPILIFGAFNPVTYAHLNMGVCAQRVFPYDNIIYVPSPDSYIRDWKQIGGNMIIPAEDRVKLLLESFEEPQYDNYVFDVSTVETDGLSDGKTLHTLWQFKGDDPIICVGADKLSEICLWYRHEDIIRNYEFLVITRNHTRGELPVYLQDKVRKITYTEGSQQLVSSSIIRQAWYEDELDGVKSLIPRCVYDYLKARKC